MRTTQARLEAIERIIKEPSFRQNKGLGNEVGYYIFDYPAKDELTVREWVKYCQGKNEPAIDGFSLMVFDLYDIMIDALEQEGFLEQTFKFEQRYGMGKIESSISKLLQINENSGGAVTAYIKDHTPENAVVFLIGVGKCHTVLRSHIILNNLHQNFDLVPVVLFYPGKYDGNGFSLFGSIEDGNYYRAFKPI